MLLSITTTHQPATDLGHLLHKHPDRLQSFPMNFGPLSGGRSHVFYSEATPQICTAVLLLEVDPIGRSASAFAKESVLNQTINDRPYIASSFLSLAVLKVFKTAMLGRSTGRPDLAKAAIPLTVNIPVLPCRGGEALLQQLFEPLGYEVAGQLLSEKTLYLSATLRNTVRLADLLSHLCVLVAALDDEKHDWLSDDEIDKILQQGAQWIDDHPLKTTILQRYEKLGSRYADTAIARLEEDDSFDMEAAQSERTWKAIAAKKPNNLNQQRLTAVIQALEQQNAKHVVDLGCGEGELLQRLSEEDSVETIVGVDVSSSALALAQKRLNISELGEQISCVQLMRGSVVYQDRRLQGCDAVTVIEVIEHIDSDRLPSFEQATFGFLQPKTVVVTTPNVEYNILYPMPADALRDLDHRFEWTRQAFQAWAEQVAKKYGYTVEFRLIGTEYLDLGAPTQMGIFCR